MISKRFKIILGEDSFTQWFANYNHSLNKRIKLYETCIRTAYQNGVRYFMCPLHVELSKTLKNFKAQFTDIKCIANPQWGNYYYYHTHTLWTNYYMSKCVATINNKVKNISSYFLEGINLKDYFNDIDISNISIRKSDLEFALETLEFCDYFLIGNLWYDFLYYINRIDILNQEIQIIKEYGKNPIPIISGGKTPINTIEHELKTPLAFIWFNKYYSFPNINETITAVNNSKIEFIAYRIFEAPNNFIDLNASLSFIKESKNINGFIFGINSEKQINQTSKLIKQYFP